MNWKIGAGPQIDAREKKLPVWAQRQIETLRMHLDEAREKIAGIDRTDAVAFTEPYSDQPLPVAKLHDTIRFVIDEEQRDFIDVRLREGYLEVMTSNLLSLTPSASNVVQIRLEGTYR